VSNADEQKRAGILDAIVKALANAGYVVTVTLAARVVCVADMRRKEKTALEKHYVAAERAAEMRREHGLPFVGPVTVSSDAVHVIFSVSAEATPEQIVVMVAAARACGLLGAKETEERDADQP